MIQKSSKDKSYHKPDIEIVSLSEIKDVMQGIVEVSGENGPIVDPTNPIDDPDPDDLLSNEDSFWDENE